MAESFQPSVALAAYAEAKADGRRVLVIGNALGMLADQLVERGARFVHVCDTDPLRVAQASAKNRSPVISFGPFADGHVALQSGAFELCIVENLGTADAVSVVRRVRRSLGPRGAALFACPNPEARLPLLEVPEPGAISLDYYALYDAVAAEFEVVRMLGQAPFVGYAIADFAPRGEPEPALDSAFIPGGAEEPDWFIALASQHPVELEQFYVVQLPTRSILSASGAVEYGDAGRRARDDERVLKQRIIDLERRLRQAEGPQAAPPPNVALERELARQGAWIKELESRAGTADERANRAEAEVEELRAKKDAEIAELRSSEAVLKQRSAEIEQRNAEIEQRPSESDAIEIAAFEQQLAERGAELRRLERELREAERIGRELVRERSERPPAVRTDQSRMSAELARREADLVAATWAVDALKGRLERAPATSADGDGESARAELQQRAVLAAQIEGTR